MQASLVTVLPAAPMRYLNDKLRSMSSFIEEDE